MASPTAWRQPLPRSLREASKRCLLKFDLLGHDVGLSGADPGDKRDDGCGKSADHGERGNHQFPQYWALHAFLLPNWATAVRAPVAFDAASVRIVVIYPAYLGVMYRGALMNTGAGRDKRERFVALAEARTEKALGSIRLIGNLSNRANYEYTDEDVAEITRALEREIRLLKDRFQSSGASGGPAFRLSSARKRGN